MCLSLAAIVVLFVALRRQKKEPLIVFEEEDIRENIITYDDEGGGEEDTEAFDIATLQVRGGGGGDKNPTVSNCSFYSTCICQFKYLHNPQFYSTLRFLFF